MTASAFSTPGGGHPSTTIARPARARLNPQGLARRDAGLMSCIVADPGFVPVSIDLSAGEPSVTSHYSRDPNYLYATVDGVAKPPHYRGPVLMIDDIYLMTMSVSPLTADLMRQLFHEQRYPAGSFADQWLAAPDVIRDSLKKLRQFAKILCLGIGYGMQPKKMVESAYNAGYVLTLEQARAFYRAYWDLFAGVRALTDRLGRQMAARGSIVNPFGYRLKCPPRKAFNYFIQSSVSGIMHVFLAKLAAAAPYSLFEVCIHDELVMSVPAGRLDDFRRDKQRANDSLNADLKWSVAIRTGFAPGSNWFEAK